MSTETISTTLRSLRDDLVCEACKEGLEKRVKEIIVKWSLLKVCWEYRQRSHSIFMAVDYLNVDPRQNSFSVSRLSICCFPLRWTLPGLCKE